MALTLSLGAAALTTGSPALAQDAGAATGGSASVVAAPVPPVFTTTNPATPSAASESPSLLEGSPSAGYERMKPTADIGQPVPAGIWLQKQVTPVGEQGERLVQGILNPIIFATCILVLILLAYAIIRFRAAANPVPSTTTHNFTIEVIWTLVPALILLFIAFPSFKLLATQYDPPKADLTVKVTGYQWYWGYEYPDYGDMSFDSLPLGKDEAAAEGVPYLLDVDNRLVVPAGKTVKLLITAADVLHSFAVPSFWVKMDAVPGRVNEAWFKVDRPGVYYGQCSELCGTKHGFMPIAVEVLPEEEFNRWVRMRQQADGIEPTGPGIAPAAAPVAQAPVPEAPAPMQPDNAATAAQNNNSPAATAAAPAA